MRVSDFGGDRVEHVTIGADHPALAGHFPGQPVVPGVVLLDQVVASIGRTAGDVHAGGFRIASVKFLHPVIPPATLAIRHRPSATGVEFSIDDGTNAIVSGRIEMGGR